MTYAITTATRKLASLQKRIRAVCGGTSASKTISILLILIAVAQHKQNKKISIVSESFPHLKRGAIRDFMDIMKNQEYWNDDSWNATDKIYTFPSGSFIEFFSVDQPDKVRGPRRNILFINECNNVPYEAFDQLAVRTSEVIWLDWNPTNQFWFYDYVQNRPDVDFVTLTYKDNEALEPSIIQEIESHRDNVNWWKVYGLGQLGDVEGKVYRNWVEIEDIPKEARKERHCLDFGYSVDPTAIVNIYYWNNAFIFDEVMYQKGLSNKNIADVLINDDVSVLTAADSAEPKSIDEIRSFGVPIVPSMKGPGSITRGIQHVQAQRIFYTKRSVNLIKEYRNYMWKRMPDGTIDSRHPEDVFNHCMDAIRYGMETLKPRYEMVIPQKKETEHDKILKQIAINSDDYNDYLDDSFG